MFKNVEANGIFGIQILCPNTAIRTHFYATCKLNDFTSVGPDNTKSVFHYTKFTTTDQLNVSRGQLF